MVVAEFMPRLHIRVYTYGFDNQVPNEKYKRYYCAVKVAHYIVLREYKSYLKLQA